MFLFKEKPEAFLFVIVTTGLLIVLLISLYAAGALNLPSNHGGWIYEYQTSITGIFALLAVLIAWYQYEHTRYRRKIFMQACMMDALSELCKYCRELFLYLDERQEHLPKKRPEDIKTLKECIEFLDTKTADSVFTLLRKYQILNSRIQDYQHQNPNSFPFEDRVRDVIILHYYTLRLFAYARREINYIPDTRATYQDMSDSFAQLITPQNWHEPRDYQQILNMLDRHFR